MSCACLYVGWSCIIYDGMENSGVHSKFMLLWLEYWFGLCFEGFLSSNIMKNLLLFLMNDLVVDCYVNGVDVPHKN